MLSACPSIARAPTARAIVSASSVSSRDSSKSSREHQDLGETSYSPGTRRGRRLGRSEAHRVAIRGIGEDPLARDPRVPAEPLVEHPGTDRIGGLVDERDGHLDLGDGAGRLVEPGHPRERG